jgi:hypothetical protein
VCRALLLQCEVLNLPGPSSDAPSVLDWANLVYYACELYVLCAVCCALQCEVLNLPGPSSNAPSVLDGANLVYCAPTSGGKSLVAEVLMLRRICETNRPALLVSNIWIVRAAVAVVSDGRVCRCWLLPWVGHVYAGILLSRHMHVDSFVALLIANSHITCCLCSPCR